MWGAQIRERHQKSNIQKGEKEGSREGRKEAGKEGSQEGRKIDALSLKKNYRIQRILGSEEARKDIIFFLIFFFPKDVSSQGSSEDCGRMSYHAYQ